MTVWFAFCCLILVVLAIMLVGKWAPALERKPRRILIALLSIIGAALCVYLVLTFMFLSAC